jgi:hypothetical protein
MRVWTEAGFQWWTLVNTETNQGVQLILAVLSSFSNETLLHGLNSVIDGIKIIIRVSKLCCVVTWIEVYWLWID